LHVLHVWYWFSHVIDVIKHFSLGAPWIDVGLTFLCKIHLDQSYSKGGRL